MKRSLRPKFLCVGIPCRLPPPPPQMPATAIINKQNTRTIIKCRYSVLSSGVLLITVCLCFIFLSVWQLIPRPALAAFSSESSAWFPAAPLKFYSALILLCVVEPPHCSILLNRNRPVKFLLVFSHHRLSPLVSIFL